MFATSTCCLTAFGLYYLYDERHARLLTYRIGWKSLEYYTKCKHFYHKNAESLFFSKGDEKEGEKENKQDELIIHNVQTNQYETHVKIPNEIEYDWMVVKKYNEDGAKYKVIENMTEYDENKEGDTNINYKPFLQIEIEQDGEKIEIQDNLDFFFLENNKILDKKFLLWYLNFFYNRDLQDDYKLHIIDSSVNLITLNDKQYVVLGKTNYIIKDN